ncbi:cytochrome C nitrate reductase [Sphaerisporangium siamense]|uniref:Cytochrome d ubiquinol oxidase subunit II n=1 Tax=Sphaerisporangium siamense TaxID=795645 RepID=A0A7W7D9M8_9ACTN|nr:cytochrome d ubiquinol oxidase subunit II [Sphaerisporangium siamense]MBB4702824.1 cytochrome d ubiquinol oxidase subunit II [Sphaerisporangium siamense]GII83420.1 cytochrome C nitrate reductase [Sphaerisporangium siamense]
MDVTTFWFLVVAFLWTGYFVLEGFDFGVGALLPLVARGEAERRQALATIGPVWDGNEVWLITAVGAMFAAFPAWYSGFLSGFYLPLVMVLAGLIVRGVALEWRGKVEGRERAVCDAGIVTGSVLTAFLWGGIFGHMLSGTLAGTLVGGALSLSLAMLHGGVFLALKTTGPLRARARRAALTAAAVAVPAAALALPGVPAAIGPAGAAGADWTAHPLVWAAAVAAMVALAAGVALVWRRREGWAFTATAGSITLLTATVFAVLWQAPLPGLTVAGAASGPYTLGLLTWIGLIALPFVLGYQAWTYWVFRKRVTA